MFWYLAGSPILTVKCVMLNMLVKKNMCKTGPGRNTPKTNNYSLYIYIYI